ncbi:MAG: DsrE family protein [Firmicutes bacterium]|nr:DsrE family protein [Alicyclobacillaceae bacterium]MCL6497087.1 DsrE family protein [Bacillota bacterium]
MSARVVFHLNTGHPDRHRAALTSIANLLAEMPDATVELVIQGDALPLVEAARSTLPLELEALRARGVTVAVCRNTMRARGVSPEALLAGVEVVPSAVGELVRRQLEGFAYLKP